jgi:hypothetical protein
MSMIRRQEELRARAAELRARASQRQSIDPAASAEADEAATLERQAAELQGAVDDERDAIRHAHGGALAVLAHRVANAPPPTEPFVGAPTPEEQRQRMHTALSGVRHTADDAARHAAARERELEHLRRSR